MDIWVQRTIAAVILLSVTALAISYIRGNDGQVFSYLTGLITGLLSALGISNALVAHPESVK